MELSEDEKLICLWLKVRHALIMEGVHDQRDGEVALRDARVASAFREVWEGIERGSHRDERIVEMLKPHRNQGEAE